MCALCRTITAADKLDCKHTTVTGRPQSEHRLATPALKYQSLLVVMIGAQKYKFRYSAGYKLQEAHAVAPPEALEQSCAAQRSNDTPLFSNWTKDYIPQYPEVRPVAARYHQLTSAVNFQKKTRPIKYCALPNTILLGQEGRGRKGDLLEGVVIITRHGDRGSLRGLLNQSLVSCSVNFSSHSDLTRYVKFMRNKERERSKSDLFRHFHLLPILSEQCLSGQLSSQGIIQMLRLGKLLHQVYLKRHYLVNETTALQDVIVFCSNVPRTYQSVLAFLHSFLPSYPSWNNVKMGSGLTFCHSRKFCDCPVIDKIEQVIWKEKWTHLKSHPAVFNLIQSLTPLYGVVSDQDGGLPDSLFDSLMVYLCHQQKMPCDKNGICASVDQLNNLMAFLDWSGRQTANHGLFRRASKLRTHGLLVDIVHRLINIKSRNKKKSIPRIVIYSGHDLTLIAIMSALGFYDGSKIPYASRLIFELYKSHDSKEFHVKIIYNGRDLTKRISLCSHSKSHNIKNQTKSDFICPLSNLELYISKNFYRELNVTSFQQACSNLPSSSNKRLKSLRYVRSKSLISAKS
uniref:2-phosphoxylose phosphatase 1 n=1 Tax=Strigamia maritima TaxID=126957 RepID=T1ISF2_STRMM